MIVTIVSEPREQTRAIGVYSFVASAGGSIGLLLGGVLTDALSWHWVFFVNLPIGIATVLLAIRFVPDLDGAHLPGALDVTGSVALTVGLMAGVYALLGAETHGWTSGRTLAIAAVSLLVLAWFLVRQARIQNPMLPLRIFRSRNVTGANLALFGVLAGMFSAFFLAVRYAGEVLDYSSTQIGLAFLPITLLIGVVSTWVTPLLIERTSAAGVLMAGLAVIAAGTLWLIGTDPSGSYGAGLLGPVLLLGVGAGFCYPPSDEPGPGHRFC